MAIAHVWVFDVATAVTSLSPWTWTGTFELAVAPLPSIPYWPRPQQYRSAFLIAQPVYQLWLIAVTPESSPTTLTGVAVSSTPVPLPSWP